MKEYAVSDIHKILCLFYLGKECLRQERDKLDVRRINFVFEETPEVIQAIEEFEAGTFRVELKAIMQIQKVVKRIIANFVQ